jgi:SAM-dependent methyltransferase
VVRRRSLQELQHAWHRLGTEDPMWAVLTDPDKRGNRWDPDEFLATGRAQVDELLAQLAAQGIAVRSGSALDFGCGLGRLTQGLAPHFDEVHGVDISPSMIDGAREADRDGRCEFHLNMADDLALFSSGRFDLVLSLYVIQHVPRRLAAGYLTDMARVLAPGGVLVVQVFVRRAGALGPARQALWNLAVNARQALTRRPAMQMHAWSVVRLTGLLERAGLEVVARQHVAGPWEQVTYTAIKP